MSDIESDLRLKGVIFMKKIITISREFGSGGHDIGMEVAKRLDIPFMIMRS